MKELNELVELAEQADAVAGLIDDVNPHTILAITEAFRALEKRAESAEANHQSCTNELVEAVLQIDALRAKLAEMQKQKPAGKFALEPLAERYHHIKHGEAQHMEPKLPLVKLFTRPAPAINLAELVPEGKLSLNNGVVGWDEGWNACIAEIMRNIEEDK